MGMKGRKEQWPRWAVAEPSQSALFDLDVFASWCLEAEYRLHCAAERRAESGEHVSNNNVIRPESMIQDEYPAMILIVVCLLAYYFPRFRRLLLGPEDEFVL
jgi:hypothetical protein